MWDNSSKSPLPSDPYCTNAHAIVRMGVSVKKSTVIIDGKEKLTDAVLAKAKEKSNVSAVAFWRDAFVDGYIPEDNRVEMAQ